MTARPNASNSARRTGSGAASSFATLTRPIAVQQVGGLAVGVGRAGPVVLQVRDGGALLFDQFIEPPVDVLHQHAVGIVGRLQGRQKPGAAGVEVGEPPFQHGQAVLPRHEGGFSRGVQLAQEQLAAALAEQPLGEEPEHAGHQLVLGHVDVRGVAGPAVGGVVPAR